MCLCKLVRGIKSSNSLRQVGELLQKSMDPRGPRSTHPDGGLCFVDQGYESSDSGLGDLM